MPETVLAIDPGRQHAAWAVLRADGAVVDTAMFQTPISSLDWPHVDRMAPAMTKELTGLLRKFKPTKISAERYQARTGKGTGAAVEYCNIEIGILLAVAASHGRAVTLVLPATWKAFLGRATTGKQALESAASVLGINVTKAQTAVPITDHQADACGQGLWLLGRKTQGYESKALIDRAKASMQDIWTSRLTSRKS